MSSIISEIFEAGRVVRLETNQTVFQAGDRVRLMYLVTEGEIDLVRYSKDGIKMILARVQPGSVLAEASAYSSHYHCASLANSPSLLRSLPVSEFRERIHGFPDAAQIWAARLARELQNARMQSEIRSLKTVAERLDAWLGDNNVLPPKGQMQDLAHFLGVSREALYRELAQRRK